MSTGKKRLSLAAVVGGVALGSALGAAAANTPADGTAAFETVKQVLQHPRCQNCHIPGDAPLQNDQGQVHAQNVQRGPDGKGAPGLQCSTCHGEANPPASYGAHVPPGAPGWHLPPPNQKMVFIGLSSGELCRRLKDPKQNGNKTLADLDKHVSSDKLVLWGWSPGPGRTPVPIPHATFVEKFRAWIAAGAPCEK
jgi:hypothetical protein